MCACMTLRASMKAACCISTLTDATIDSQRLSFDIQAFLRDLFNLVLILFMPPGVQIVFLLYVSILCKHVQCYISDLSSDVGPSTPF